MANPKAEARAAYNVEYICPGPTRLAPNLGGDHAAIGDVMTIELCMHYPDCGCPEYDRAVTRWERLMEEASNECCHEEVDRGG